MKPLRDIFRSYAVFDADGRHTNGTDKESCHHYGDAYDALLDRDEIKLMMEVGVADGSSLLAWREAFPNARVVGMDIHPAAKWDGEFHLGDQRVKADCERAAAGRQFDLIVEDATHELENTLLTLFWLWPFVAPGGLYIVEEWEGAAGDRDRIRALWQDTGGCGECVSVEIVGTCGPHVQDEPLIVFRKPR